MPSGLTVSSRNNVPQTFQPVIAATKRSIEHDPVMSDKMDQHNITPGHSSVRIPYMGPLDAGRLEEGAAYGVPTTPNITTRTLSAEEYGVLSVIPRIAERRSSAGLQSKIGMAQGDAMTRIVDQTCLSLFGGLSDGVGTTTTYLNFRALAIAADQIKRRRSTHYGRKPMGENVMAILEPGQITSMLFASVTGGQGSATSASAGVWSDAVPAGMSAKVMTQHYRGSLKLGGVQVYEGSNLTVTDSSNVGSSVGGAFVKSTFGFAKEGSIENNMQKDIMHRAVLLETHGWWGTAELVDTWGYSLTGASHEIDAVTTVS